MRMRYAQSSYLIPHAPEQNLLRWFWVLHTTRSKVAQGPLFMRWCSVRNQLHVPHNNRKGWMENIFMKANDMVWAWLNIALKSIRTFTYKMHLVRRAAQVILYSRVARWGVPVSEHPPPLEFYPYEYSLLEEEKAYNCIRNNPLTLTPTDAIKIQHHHTVRTIHIHWHADHTKLQITS